MGFRRPKRPSHAIDMAPLIDVVFLLLIFFMLTSSFSQPSLPLDLPKATGSATSQDRAVVVSVDAAGLISVDGAAVGNEAFESTLRQLAASAEGTPLPIHFRGDRTMDYGVFVDLMDRAKDAGFTRFHLVHESRPSP